MRVKELKRVHTGKKGMSGIGMRLVGFMQIGAMINMAFNSGRD